MQDSDSVLKQGDMTGSFLGDPAAMNRSSVLAGMPAAEAASLAIPSIARKDLKKDPTLRLVSRTSMRDPTAGTHQPRSCGSPSSGDFAAGTPRPKQISAKLCLSFSDMVRATCPQAIQTAGVSRASQTCLCPIPTPLGSLTGISMSRSERWRTSSLPQEEHFIRKLTACASPLSGGARYS